MGFKEQQITQLDLILLQDLISKKKIELEEQRVLAQPVPKQPSEHNKELVKQQLKVMTKYRGLKNEITTLENHCKGLAEVLNKGIQLGEYEGFEMLLVLKKMGTTNVDINPLLCALITCDSTLYDNLRFKNLTVLSGGSLGENGWIKRAGILCVNLSNKQHISFLWTRDPAESSTMKVKKLVIYKNADYFRLIKTQGNFLESTTNNDLIVSTEKKKRTFVF